MKSIDLYPKISSRSHETSCTLENQFGWGHNRFHVIALDSFEHRETRHSNQIVCSLEHSSLTGHQTLLHYWIWDHFLCQSNHLVGCSFDCLTCLQEDTCQQFIEGMEEPVLW